MLLGAFGSLPLLLQLAATLSVALLFVGLLGVSLPPSPKEASHSQDATLALYWMHRTHNTPYRDWFCEPEADAGGETRRRAFQALVREGNIVMPLHAVYLWVLGHVVRLYASVMAADPTRRLLTDVWDRDFFSFLEEEKGEKRSDPLPESVGQALFTVRWVAALFLAFVLFQLSVEVVWPLVVRIAELFGAALQQRNAVAAARTGAPSAVASSPSSTKEEAVAWTRSLSVVGFVVVFAVVALPTLAIELTTLHPVCLCTCVMLRCVHLLCSDEHMLTSPESYTHDRFTNEESKKLFQQGSVFAFPLKKPHTLRYLCEAAALLTMAALTLRPCLSLAMGLAGWLLTLCYLRLHRRVLVRVKAPDGGAETPEAASDGFVDVGFSSYQDRMHMQVCLCCVTACALAVIFVLCFPFVFQKQRLFSFMHILAPEYHAERSFYGLRPEAARRTAAAGKPHKLTEEEVYLSVTGARETLLDCVSDPLTLPRSFSCPRPVLSVFSVTEFFGFPWTRMMVRFAGLIAKRAADAWSEGSMWMQYVSVFSLVLANSVPILLLLIYRLRRPHMSFDTPLAFVHEYDRQKEIFFGYWAAQSEQTRARRNNPSGEVPRGTADPSSSPAGGPKKGKHPDDTTKTCISHEEYLLKQLTALLWTLLAFALAANLFLIRSGLPLSVASAALLPAGLLYAMQSMIGYAEHLAPGPFRPERNRRQYDALAQLKLEQQSRAQRERKEKARAGAAEADKADETSGGDEEEPNGEGRRAAAQDEKKPKVTAKAADHCEQAPLAELPTIPAEHECTRTFTATNYSYTTPSFSAEGTGWSLSSRWCSPAALGEYSDAGWCVLVVAVVAALCLQAYPHSSSASVFVEQNDVATGVSRGGAFAVGALFVLLCVELVSSRFWARTDLLRWTVLLFLQAAGGYAALKGVLLTSSAAAPSDGTHALLLWLRSATQVFTGPTELFHLMVAEDEPSRAAHPVVSLFVWSCMYRHALACLCLFLAGVHASLRMARLMLASEEVRFIDPGKEMDMIYSAAKEERRKQEQTQAPSSSSSPTDSRGRRKKAKGR